MVTSPKDLLDEGNIFLINKDYDSAEIRFSRAIEILEQEKSEEASPPSIIFRAFSHRSATLLSIPGRAVEALTDAKSALCILESGDGDEVNSTNAIPGLIFGEVAMARGRVGMALYTLEEYVEAKDAFKHAAKLGKDSCVIDWSKWVLKCEEMVGKVDVVPKAATREAGNVSKTNAKTRENRSVAHSMKTSAVASSSRLSSSNNQKKPVCPKYQYYQNESVLTIAILESKVQSEDLKVDISLDKLTVLLKKDGLEFTVICGTLFDAVDVSKCRVKITDEKVLIKLRKKEKNYEWRELFGTGAREKDDESISEEKANGAADIKDVPQEIPKVDTNTNRPYQSDRDWDAIERNLKKEEENEKPQGDEALNKLFRDIYGKSDEETRRAMIKSYQTSGGTVLSTNWDEVSKKDYEKVREVPNGMEWKNWEGKKLPQKD